MIQSINKRLWVIERSNACRAHNCRILLTDERMNCYCCLSKMNEKFSLLYRKSSSFIYLLIFIFWFIEIHLKIEIFVCHENFFFWSSHLRSSLSLRFDFIRIAYSSSNSLISRRFRKSIDLKDVKQRCRITDDILVRSELRSGRIAESTLNEFRLPRRLSIDDSLDRSFFLN
jgi:hypothetical protein